MRPKNRVLNFFKAQLFRKLWDLEMLFYLYAKCGTMDEIHTVNGSKCDIPLSEIFRILLQDRRYIEMGHQEVRLGGVHELDSSGSG